MSLKIFNFIKNHDIIYKEIRIEVVLMGTGIYFPLCSLFYSLLLIMIFFSKKRLAILENKLYAFMILEIAISLTFEILCNFVGLNIILNPFLRMFILKAYIVTMMIWVVVFTVYVFCISYKNEIKEPEKFIKRIVVSSVIASSILAVICFSLPLHLFIEGEVRYTYGPGVDFGYIIGGICFVIWIGCLFINIKQVRQIKYLPIFVFIVLLLIVVIIQRMYPGILVMTSAQTFVTFLMFFTIENPDLKLINELAIAKEQADKANMAKSDFLSNMSHEIRTPLNAIVGFAQTLSESDIPEDSRDEVKDIMVAAENLIDIVNGILDISKIEANKLEIVNTEYSFNKVFNEIVLLAKGRLGEKPLEFKVNFDPSTPHILYGDYIRIKQVIINILTNSIKYTREGYIDFRVSSVVLNDVCRLIVSIEDTGIGIKPEQIESMFNKFERADLEKNISIEGTGLGLAITKRLVELMNGRLVVQSLYGKGSKFTFIVEQEIVKNPTIVEEDEASKENKTILDASGKRVLVVDDNMVNLKVASKLLKIYNAEVELVSSGDECLAKISEGNKYDIIFLDDMMPKMSGVETLKHLKENPEYNIPTIALTANAITGMREKYLSDGFNDYLAKPLSRDELDRVVNIYLGSK